MRNNDELRRENCELKKELSSKPKCSHALLISDPCQNQHSSHDPDHSLFEKLRTRIKDCENMIVTKNQESYKSIEQKQLTDSCNHLHNGLLSGREYSKTREEGSEQRSNTVLNN